MPRLVINAPRRTTELGDRSFEGTLRSGVGEDYAIYSELAKRLSPGSTVIVLSKDERKQAEGQLLKLEPTVLAANGVQRYNVHIRALVRANYQGDNIRLNHCGVAVID